MKFECPTFLRSKGKVMVVTLSDDEVSDQESRSDEDGNFFAFITTTVINESELIEENLQEPYNKLCKVAAKDAMTMDLGLKKIATMNMKRKACC